MKSKWPCSLVTRLHGAISQMTVIFLLEAVRPWDLLLSDCLGFYNDGFEAVII
jgi:hypothetical protein